MRSSSVPIKERVARGVCVVCGKNRARVKTAKQIVDRAQPTCPHCKQTIRCCSNCGKPGHRADSCDVHSGAST